MSNTSKGPLVLMVEKLNPRLLVIAAGFSLLVPAWIGLFSAGGSITLYSPGPILTLLAASTLSRWRLEFLAILIPSIVFFLWAPGLLLNQQPEVPRRTTALLGFLTALTVAYFVWQWNNGVRYLGVSRTVGDCLMNLILLVFLWRGIIHGRRQPSFGTNLFLHWFLFAWLAWYAFPCLSELP